MKDVKVGRGGVELGSKFPIVLLHANVKFEIIWCTCNGTITD